MLAGSQQKRAPEDALSFILGHAYVEKLLPRISRRQQRLYALRNLLIGCGRHTTDARGERRLPNKKPQPTWGDELGLVLV